MNHYGAMAERHWRETAPRRYRELENPEAFFTELGEEVQSRVLDLAAQLAGPDLPDEEYLQKLGRLNAAKNQAEEIVLTELVWIEPEPAESEAFEAWAATHPTWHALTVWNEQTAAFDLEEADLEPMSAEQMAEETSLPLELVRTLQRANLLLDRTRSLIRAQLRQQWEAQGKPAPSR
jgi:urease accessory protein UreH